MLFAYVFLDWFWYCISALRPPILVMFDNVPTVVTVPDEIVTAGEFDIAILPVSTLILCLPLESLIDKDDSCLSILVSRFSITVDFVHR